MIPTASEGNQEKPKVQKRPKIIITGGLGFIFSHVTEYFVKKGWEVVVFDNLSEGSHPEIIDGSFKFYNLGLEGDYILGHFLTENPEYIIHAAAISDVDSSINYPKNTIYENTLANLNVFEAARNLRNLKKLIYINTDEVYGECDHPKREDEVLFPRNPYSASKATGALMRIAYDSTYVNLRDKTAEVRMCNIFGPRQDKRKILPAIKESLEGNYSLPLHDHGKGYREYLYVKNIPPLMDLILAKGDRVYNITLNDGFTVMGLIKKAEKLTGKRCVTHPGGRPGMDMRYEMDNTRIMNLGWKPEYSFERGLEEYLLGE